MTLTDILLLAATAVFVFAWWTRRMPARRIVLVASALAMLAAGIAGYLTDRWQDAAGATIAVIDLLVLAAALLKNRITTKVHSEGVPWISGALVTLLAVIPALAVYMFPVWDLPKPSGPHLVGVRTLELDDASRPGVFRARADEPRRLLVRIWYPAQSVSGPPAPYFTEAETKTTAKTFGRLVGFADAFTYVRHVQTHSYPNAPLLAGASNLPVVFYSHGYTSFLNQNTVLMEHLASHGYVVVSIQHTYDSADTVFPNGDVAPQDPALMEMAANDSGRPSQADAFAGATLDDRLKGALAYEEYSIRTGDRITAKSTPTWVADRLFVHDTLQRRPPAAVADIAAASNFAHVGETGMSFGGAIAGEICILDPRCAAGVNLDGGNFPFSTVNANVPAPFLMFHSDASSFYAQYGKPLPKNGVPRSFNEFSYEPLAEAGRRSDVYRVRLRGSLHLGLSDFSLFMRRPLSGLVFGTAPPEIIVGAQNDFVLSFLDQHLRGMDSGFPKKQLAAYAGWVDPVPNADVATWWAAKPEAERAAIEARINSLKRRYPPQPE